MQFVNPHILSPLWEFSMSYCMFDKTKKNKITGYYNLNKLQDKLENIIIRREKRNVLDQLPPIQEVDVPIELSQEQREIHAGYVQSVQMILSKKFMTLADHQRLMLLLTCMRMVCNSTFLIDHETNISPKLNELKEILLSKLDIKNNNRKIIIFSEWKTMLSLISQQLSKLNIGHTTLSGDVPVHKRGALITEFETNEKCRIFLSTEAGGTGLNLQVADTVINFELPWNPAKKNQRIGRIDRLGQKAEHLTVINLISSDSIEAQIATGIMLKQELFDSVMDDSSDKNIVDFSKSGRATFFKQLKEFMINLDENHDYVEKEDTSDTVQNQTSKQTFLDEIIERDSQLADQVHESGDLAEQKSYTEPAQDSAEEVDKSAAPFSEQESEVLEDTLNKGLEFLSGIMQMTTGKGFQTDQKSITVDKNSGEVTMKFKLPGF